jgi:hypothetical protein
MIEITVSPRGETRVETKGYSGSDCVDASKWLEAALGSATAEHKSAEYYSSAATAQQEISQ